MDRTRSGRGSRFLLSVGALVLGAICVLTGRADAQQVAAGCGDANPGGTCVMMIQVDGLEATDVTQEKTPFLWELAHPTDNNPVTGGGRNGWIWQAPRASMSAGLAANVASFLVGGYAEQTGVPADDFHLGGPQADPAEDGSRQRLGGSELQPDGLNIPAVADSGAVGGDPVLRLVKEQIGDAGVQHIDTTAAFVGDPNLGPLVTGSAPDFPEVDFGWYPTPGDQGSPPPALCDVPRVPAPPPPPASPPPPRCAATDAVTLARAFQDLTAQNAGDVTLTYIELAELGRVKRSGANPGDVTTALQTMNGALETFISGYSQQQSTSDQWEDTVVMVAGTSGYEQALPNQRVPDPTNANQDLANFVENFDAAGNGGDDFHLVPQGTVATVYSERGLTTDAAANPTQLHRDQLAELKAAIEGVNGNCDPDCIEQVLYMRSQMTPTGSTAGTVEGEHPDWHLDHLSVKFNQQTGDTTTIPTGRSGELLVQMSPGWASGKAVPADAAEALASDREVITNPYLASTGGPRNRAVAAIIHGPGIAQMGGDDPGWYPVAGQPEGTPENPVCNAAADPDGAPDPTHQHLMDANAMPEDDANADGHECQAELLDFAPTTAALLHVAMPSEQICGRILNEAFVDDLVETQSSEDAPDAFFTQGPVTPSAGQQYPQTDRNVTFEFDTTVRNRAIVRCGETTTVPTTFECSLDSAAYSACTSPVNLTGLAKGIHSFCVRAVSDELRSEPDCATFEVLLLFDFEGVIRDLRATVTDYEGKTWAQAPKGRRMNRILISADYGKQLSAVTLTLYKQSTRGALCGDTVFRPKAAASAAGGAQAAATCPLTGIAKFKPFKLDRGHIDLKLRIPKAYKPTHVGVTAQEVVAKQLDAASAAQCQQSGDFFCLYSKVGAAEGGIVQIVDARKLHRVKGKKKQKKKKRKKKK